MTSRLQGSQTGAADCDMRRSRSCRCRGRVARPATVCWRCGRRCNRCRSGQPERCGSSGSFRSWGARTSSRRRRSCGMWRSEPGRTGGAVRDSRRSRCRPCARTSCLRKERPGCGNCRSWIRSGSWARYGSQRSRCRRDAGRPSSRPRSCGMSSIGSQWRGAQMVCCDKTGSPGCSDGWRCSSRGRCDTPHT